MRFLRSMLEQLYRYTHEKKSVSGDVGDMFNGTDLIITGFSTVCDPTALLAVGSFFARFIHKADV